MPAVTLTFTLPDEAEDLEQALNGHKRCSDFQSALSEVWTKLRNKTKYEQDVTEAEMEIYLQVKEWISSACDNWDVDVWG